MIENRRTYRLPFRSKFIFASENTVRTGTTFNLSAGGSFIMTLEPFVRGTRCECLFLLDDSSLPLKMKATVQRVVAPTTNPEETPGMGLAFSDSHPDALKRIAQFMFDSRRLFETASTIMSSGEPDLQSLQPLLSRMHLPAYGDLGELRFYIERVLRSIELVDRTADAEHLNA